MKRGRLLIVDDQPDIGAFVCKVAESVGYQASFADSGDIFKEKYVEISPDVIILDLAMPNTDGVELLQFLSGQKSPSRILLMSGFGEKICEVAQRLGEAQGLDMIGVILKPVAVSELRSRLENAVPHTQPLENLS